jgi:hypothetical protein
LTFEQFLHDAAEKGTLINTLFEERLFGLLGTLERVARPLVAAKVPYELIGGMAVLLHVNRVEPSAIRNTKDIDIMIQRADLERIEEVLQGHGFAFGDGDDVDGLTTLKEKIGTNAVHLVFSEERTRANQAAPNPALRPEELSVYGLDVAVIPVLDLVSMKLANNRDIDRVHIRDLDSVGLITSEIGQALPPVLYSRLTEIRCSE